MKLYDVRAIARFLDVSERRVRQLRDEKVIAEVRPGLYDLIDTNHRYINYLRKRNPEGDETIDYNTERAKLVRAKRKNEEYELQLKENQLHAAEDIEAVMTDMLVNFKSRLMAIPSKLAPVLCKKTDKAEIFALLKDHIDEALMELSDFKTTFGERVKEDEKATVDLFTRIFSVLAPPPNMTVSQWADKYRRLSSESSAEPGRWRTSKAPYQREIMDAVCDMRVQKVVIMSAAQIGKTDALILNPIGYYMHYDPSPIMVMQPTIQMAETFSKDRLSPMLRDTPVLRDKVNDKSRNSGNTILQKIFPGGHVTMVGANSPSSLASRPIRILLADEIDRYPATAGNEGDPLLLAGKRLATFWNKKEVCVSTPTNKETSRIAVEFEHSTQEEWNVPCPACGAFTPLLWANIVFDRDKLDEIGCTCPACGVVSSETEWKEQYINGKFVAAHPERKVRGFHLNALASLFVDWREIVEKFLTANEEKKKGNIELLKVWTNTEMGETWEEDGEQIETDDLYKRREKYNCEVPEEVLVLTAGVDVQDDRFEAEVVGWGVDKESWGIKYQVIYGDLKLKPVWDELDRFLSQTFTTADGRHLKIICACVDSGGHFTTQVYRFCKERTARRVFAIKGKGGAEVPYFNRPSTANNIKTPLFTVGVDTGKALLYQRLAVQEEGPNYCHFPREKDRGYTQEYFKGLTAEKMVISYKRGKAQYVWTLKDGGYKRNEPLDIRNYATVALEIANPILKPPEHDTTTPAPRRRGRRSRTNGGIL